MNYELAQAIVFATPDLRELSEEIQAHLDEKVEELVAEGMSREEAMFSARREFGNVGLIEEDCREVWVWPSVEDVLFDIRYGLRALRHSPVFTAVALLTIAIGIAANAAVFSVVNSVLLKPLNYPKAEELVALHQVAPGAEGLADFENGLLLSPSMYFTYAEHNQTFQSVGVWIPGSGERHGHGGARTGAYGCGERWCVPDIWRAACGGALVLADRSGTERSATG